MTLRYLDLESFKAVPLTREPFQFLTVPNFLTAEACEAINRDYPKIAESGSFPAAQLKFGPAFQEFLDELGSDEFRAAFEEKFGLDLTGRPHTVTVRGRCAAKDGRIHTDTKSKRLEGRSGSKQTNARSSRYGTGAGGEWDQNWLEVATRLCRVDDGLPRRLDRNPRLKALGNAIVPQVAEQIMIAIKNTSLGII